MRFRQLDMNLLAALDILIRTRSVSRAAEEMFLTQSAMSNALGRLRQYFDDPLLVQVGRRMDLTPLARSLEGPVRDIMLRVENAVLLSPEFDPATSARAFSLVVSDYTLVTVGAALSASVAQEAPGVRLNFRPQHLSPWQLLERGEADLLVAPDWVCSPNHPRDILFADPLMVIACASGPYAAGIDDAGFGSAAHVMMVPNTGQDSFAAIALREAGVFVEPKVTTYSFASIPALIRGTNRIALVQGLLAQQAVRAGGVVAHPCPVELPPLVQCMQLHDLRALDPGVAWLKAKVRSAADTLLAGRG